MTNAGKVEEAIKLLQKLIDKVYADPEQQKLFYCDLARLYWYSSNKDEAIAAAKKAGNKGLIRFFETGDHSILEKEVDKKYAALKENSEYISQLWMGMDYARAGAREKALESFNNAVALKDVAVTLLLMGHYEFLNIRYLSMALLMRKIKLLVNF
jgi:tetratricopeptide (TPR) repeat protein